MATKKPKGKSKSKKPAKKKRTAKTRKVVHKGARKTSAAKRARKPKAHPMQWGGKGAKAAAASVKRGAGARRKYPKWTPPVTRFFKREKRKLIERCNKRTIGIAA